MPSYPNPGADFNLPPELLAYYSNLPRSTGDYPAGFDPTAGVAPAAAAGPPGMEGLEGGWGHVASDPLAFIQELLTPRNVQGRTDFAGGSHFGPGREMSIPQENFAQAANLLKILSERDKYQSDKGRGDTADDLMRRRLEAERGGPGYSPGSMSMGGETQAVGDTIGEDGNMIPGKISVQAPQSASEIGALIAGGYPDPRYPSGSRGGYGVVDPSKQTTADAKTFKEAREYLGQLIEMQRSAETEEEAAALGQEIASVRQHLSSQFGSGGEGSGTGETAETGNEQGWFGRQGDRITQGYQLDKLGSWGMDKIIDSLNGIW